MKIKKTITYRMQTKHALVTIEHINPIYDVTILNLTIYSEDQQSNELAKTLFDGIPGIVKISIELNNKIYTENFYPEGN